MKRRLQFAISILDGAVSRRLEGRAPSRPFGVCGHAGAWPSKLVHGVILFFSFVALTSAPAQVDVRKPWMKRSIAISGFTGDTGTLTEVLRNDAKLSFCFLLSTPTDAEFVQQGTVRGDAVECTVVQRLSQRTVLSKTYPMNKDLRRLAHAISDDMVQAITGQRGIAQTKIAFIYSKGRVRELAMMDYDGHNVRQLTSDNSISSHPRWSPDGRRIIYNSYLQTYLDVFEADIVTHARRKVAGFPGMNSGAEYSPDGATIALTLSKDGNPELYTMSAGGGGLKRLTNTKGAESSPTWSPDGRQIAYVSDDRGSPQIYLIDRDGGEPTRLTVSPSYNTEPAWSRPPASAVVPPTLIVTSRVGGRFQLGKYNDATREVEPLADDADCADGSWAPDGRHIVFCKTQNWKPRLYLLDVLTREQVELPAVDGGMSEPAWGP